MTTETKILTVDEMTSLACRHEAHGESWPDAEYRFRESDVLAFSEAVEQAILQSAQVQAWKKDAERYRWLKEHIQADYELPGGYYIPDEDTCTWDKTIDAAKEKQP